MDAIANDDKIDLPVMSLKGKNSNRGWATLPVDVLKIVLNHVVRDSDAQHMPTSWQDEFCWANRLLFNIIRASNVAQKYMCVCRTWRISLANHNFWAHACSALDPYGQILTYRKGQIPQNNSSAVDDIRPNHLHLQHIRAYTCIACRMRNPSSKEGCHTIRRVGRTAYTGKIGLCREHKIDTVCAICLRSESPTEESLDFIVCKTEDEDVFPMMEATCTKCRSEVIAQRAMHDSVLCENWDKLQTDRLTVDWEVRQALEQFIDYGEGTVNRVVAVGWEKQWLRRYTKLVEYLDQAVASVRYQNREDGYETEDEASDDEDVLCFQEEAGVRDIAMTDYCRGRLLDGIWTMPMDSHVALLRNYYFTVIPAHHPVPYIFPTKPGEHHPTRRHVDSVAPPTADLAHSLTLCFQNEMRKIIGPAMQNLVRKIVLECARASIEPSMIASRMDVEAILQGLRQEGVWWDNFDWAGQWQENDKQIDREHSRGRSAESEEESSHSSASDGSRNSHETSPVLSTSTLHTTPSPPPNEQQFGDKVKMDHHNLLPTPQKMPTILRIIPYVPESSYEMPYHTQEVLRCLWREAVQPLFHCKCTICTRAMQMETSNSGANAIGQVANILTASSPIRQPEIEDAFAPLIPMDEDAELMEAIAFERELNAEHAAQHIVPSQKRGLTRSASPRLGQRGHKRSSEEIDSIDSEPLEAKPLTTSSSDPVNSFSYPVKIKRSTTPLVKKRRSEELEVMNQDNVSDAWAKFSSPKRLKQSDPESTPRALSRHGSVADKDVDQGHAMVTQRQMAE